MVPFEIDGTKTTACHEHGGSLNCPNNNRECIADGAKVEFIKICDPLSSIFNKRKMKILQAIYCDTYFDVLAIADMSELAQVQCDPSDTSELHACRNQLINEMVLRRLGTYKSLLSLFKKIEKNKVDADVWLEQQIELRKNAEAASTQAALIEESQEAEEASFVEDIDSQSNKRQRGNFGL